MAVDERRRVELYDRLSTAIGHEATDTLMAMLPPGGEEVATKSDIAQLENRLDRRFEAIDARFEVLEQKLEGTEHKLTGVFERSIREAVTMQTRTLVFSQLGSLVVIAALAFGLR